MQCVRHFVICSARIPGTLCVKNYTRYAVPDLKGISASGRAEETRSFFKKIHFVDFLKKE